MTAVDDKAKEIGIEEPQLLKLARESAEDGRLISIAHLTVFGRAQLERDLEKVAESRKLEEEASMAATR